MNSGAEILAEFGHSLGMERLQWPNSGVVVLDFDERGTLYLENLEDVLLVYLARDIDLRDGKLKYLQSALRFCHYREGLPFTVQTGLRNENRLVFAVSLSSSDVTLPILEDVLETLSRLHDNVREG